MIELIVETLYGKNYNDSNNAAIVLGQSCDSVEKSLLLIEKYDTVPKVLEMLSDKRKGRLESGLLLMINMTKFVIPPHIRHQVRCHELVDVLFGLLSNTTVSSYNKVQSAQWYHLLKLFLIILVYRICIRANVWINSTW